MEITQTYKVKGIETTAAGIWVKLVGNDDTTTLDLLVPSKSYSSMQCKEGEVLSTEKCEALILASDLNRAISRTVKILSYSDHSKAQLIKKLVAYGFERETAVLASLEAVKLGYINEEEQAKRTALYYAKNKYWGKKRIAAELIVRGYERAAALAALTAITEEEYLKSLKHVISRKYLPIPTEYGERTKAISALCRLGYSGSEINRAFEELQDEK